MENTMQVPLFDGKTKELADVRVFHKEATAEEIKDCFNKQIPYAFHGPLPGETKEFFFDSPVEGRQYLYIKGVGTVNE